MGVRSVHGCVAA